MNEGEGRIMVEIMTTLLLVDLLFYNDCTGVIICECAM